MQFFEELLPKKLGSWGFVTGLMVPEYELFAMLYAPDSLAPGTKAGRVDFYLPQAALAIEIDGSQHQKKIASTVDENRDQFLARHGIRTIRIPTDDIRKNGAPLQEAINQIMTICEETPELQAHAKIRSGAPTETVRHDLAAAARLQLTLIALIRSGHLSVEDERWDLTVAQDFAEGINLKWAQVAATDLLEWFDCFAGVYGEDFTAPTVNWSDDGHRVEMLLHRRPDEALTGSRHTVVTTSAVQFLPQEGGGISRADPEPKPDHVPLAALPRNLSGAALERLNRMVFGHEAFRPGQLDLIRNIFTGANTLGLMPTGAGKSLAFQFPGLLCPGTTIVVVPIRALGRDHTAELDSYGFSGRSVNIDSVTPAQERSVIYRKMVQGCFRFVFVSPERFQTEEFKKVVKAAAANQNLNFFTVDEAHCLSEWGHNFRPSYLTLPGTLRTLGPKTPVICVTATAAVNTLKDLQTGFNISDEMVCYEMHRGRPELAFGVANTKSVMTDLVKQVQTHLAKSSGKERPCPPGLIFSPYVNGATGALSILTELAVKMPELRLALFTGSEPQNVDVGDLVHLLRDKEAKADNFEEYKAEVQDRWKRGQIDLVVATKAFGMGVNKADVRFTLHAGMPSSMEAFYQEAGRAGRDGKKASGTILFKREPDKKQAWFQKVLNSPGRSTIETQLQNVGRSDWGDLRAQLWFLNNSNSDISTDLKRLQKILAVLPPKGGVTVINRNNHKAVIDDGHYFQVTLFRLHQLGVVSSWSVEEWGVESGGVAVVEAHSEPLHVEHALDTLKDRVEAIQGKGAASLVRIEQVRPGILSEANPDSAWARLFYELLSWVQQSQLRSRLVSMEKLYDECVKFTPERADLFKQQLQNHFIIDQDSLALAELKDLTLEEAVGPIMTALLSPQGQLKPPAALRKLEAQTARLREGTSDNPALNLVAGVLQLVTDPEEASGWQQLMWSATGEAGSHRFWFGPGRPVLEKITEAAPAVAEEMASFLLTGDQTLDQLSEVNQFFKSERTRVLLLGAIADKLVEEI
ncbi:DEAD/DEAH box helicase [Luminiphilus sp.]|nr:DEAD/DEAH box helicase [Luminiphilus sp.]MDA9681901.1 DEAD/DEAH box helicase [Luminiphilus sp.]